MQVLLQLNVNDESLKIKYTETNLSIYDWWKKVDYTIDFFNSEIAVYIYSLIKGQKHILIEEADDPYTDFDIDMSIVKERDVELEY